MAEEAVSCVVKEVTVYLSTPLTDKGLTIVDTPGASSMNKRHTEIAFQYMKDADALLYLTYYQHSFSKADRSFLRKLGLVKIHLAWIKCSLLSMQRISQRIKQSLTPSLTM